MEKVRIRCGGAQDRGKPRGKEERSLSAGGLILLSPGEHNWPALGGEASGQPRSKPGTRREFFPL